MKTPLITFLFASALFTSCGSLVTLQDIQKQEERARDAVSEARAETIELAQMKEEYSVDKAKAKIDELEKEKKTIEKDINSLKNVSTETAATATAGTLQNLENQRDQIDDQISNLKGVKAENWDEAIERVEKDIQSLRGEIAQITANIRSAD